MQGYFTRLSVNLTGLLYFYSESIQVLMFCEFTIGNDTYRADLQNGHCIAIPLRPNQENPNCFYAPPPMSSPVRHGDWVGDISQGGNLNFLNLTLNPHGNGTHTECIAHIHKADNTIHKTLTKTMFSASVVTLFPEKLDNGDRVIGERALEIIEELPATEAIVIRTLPNAADKMTRNYSGTNPPYISADFAAALRKKGIQHLLIDLPSLDREEDGGLLLAHKAFWNVGGDICWKNTVTEMIFVGENIKDGVYLLELGICALDIDVSPSRPVIYATKKV